jgi:HEPN domain-containing protein
MTAEDSGRIAETSAWLRRASQDMRAAAHGLRADPPLLDDVVFHCQQAVEKSLLGFLVWHQREHPQTHDIAMIGRDCTEIDPTLQLLIQQAAPLSDYAWKYRYPSDEETPSHAETSEAMNVTHAVVEAVIERLPAEARRG